MSKISSKKVLLAFSGGLDTTFCALYLQHELNYEVHTALVDTGGFSEVELQEVEKKAKALNVKSFKVLKGSKDFYEHCLKYLIFGNVLKNNTYPLSVSAERVFQAKMLADYAQEMKVDAIAHGSTGAGNDQVRFDLTFSIVCPDKEIITPIRDLKLSREEELKLIKKYGISIDETSHLYSINKGIWGTSVGGKETLSSHSNLPEEAYPYPVEDEKVSNHTLHFKKGNIVGFDDYEGHPTQVIEKIELEARKYGIGRDVHVGDTILGIKGRVGFQAASPLVILKAHHLLEKHVLTKQQLLWKDQLSSYYGTLLHDGMYLEPLMRDIEKFLESTQQRVTGEVFVKFDKYRFELIGIQSKFDMMASKAGMYGEMNNAWTGDDVKGFIKIYSNQLNIYNQIKEDE